MDLGPETLHMLVQLMCGQARECLFEKTELSFYDKNRSDLSLCLELGQEAAHVSDVYEKVFDAISNPPVKDYVPFSWVSLAQVKREHYKALANYYVAVGLLDHENELESKHHETLQFLHDMRPDKVGTKVVRPTVPESRAQRFILGKAHLREAALQHEEALRVNRMCRELRKKDILSEVLRLSHDRSLNKYADVDDEDDFQEVVDPPPIMPATTYQLTLAFPDFSQYKVMTAYGPSWPLPSPNQVTDLFRCLGPVAVFSAKHHWTAPRTIQLRKKEDEGYGFSVRGDAPVVVAGVETDSLADIGGMREGDYLVAIGDRDVKWSSHADVVREIKTAENTLRLRLVTPMDRSLTKTSYKEKSSLKCMGGGSISPTSTSSSSSSSGLYSPEEGLSPASSESSGSTREQLGLRTKKNSWSIFSSKKSSRRHERDEFCIEENVIFR